LPDPPVWRTDGRTDGQTELRWLRRAIAVPAVARKNIIENPEKSFHLFRVHHDEWLNAQINYHVVA